MPAYLPQNEALGVKVASICSGNLSQGLPTVTALITLLDSQTGLPVAIMEGTYLTSLRTGAASGLATDLLARKDVHTLAVIGAGAQARTQIEAVNCVRNIQETHLYSRTRISTETLARELAHTCPKLTVVVAKSSSEAVKGADIVVAATNSSTPVFNGTDIMDGAHINAIGSFRPDMQEIDEYTVKRSIVIVDQCEAVLSEAGDIVIPLRKGIITEQHIQAELGEIVAGEKIGRKTANDVTLFKSVGNAAQDIGVAKLVLESAAANNLGAIVPL